jgi:transcriptional regulator with XRE-family HTH domain
VKQATNSNLNERIAERVRNLRAAERLSLDALANKSGVSRSMISLIERGESSPTAVVLEKIAAALNVTLASLFEPPAKASRIATEPISRRKDQQEWQDPGSGYIRRNVSPAHVAQPIRIIEVHFPPGERVAFESTVRDVRVYQQIWILEGSMNIGMGDQTYRLNEDDCLAIQLDLPMMFHNPTRKAARYAVIIASETPSRR